MSFSVAISACLLLVLYAEGQLMDEKQIEALKAWIKRERNLFEKVKVKEDISPCQYLGETANEAMKDAELMATVDASMKEEVIQVLDKLKLFSSDNAVNETTTEACKNLIEQLKAEK